MSNAASLHDYFAPHVRSARIKKRVVSVVMLVLCASVAAWASSKTSFDRSESRMVAAAILGGLTALIVLALSFRKSRGLATLAKPETIVWFYGMNRAGTVHAVMIGSTEGKLHRLDLPLISRKEGFSMEAFTLLKAHCPHATQGFSESTRVQFRTDPASLRKA